MKLFYFPDMPVTRFPPPMPQAKVVPLYRVPNLGLGVWCVQDTLRLSACLVMVPGLMYLYLRCFAR